MGIQVLVGEAVPGVAAGDHDLGDGHFVGLVQEQGVLAWRCYHDHLTRNTALECSRQAAALYNQLVGTGRLVRS